MVYTAAFRQPNNVLGYVKRSDTRISLLCGGGVGVAQ